MYWYADIIVNIRVALVYWMSFNNNSEQSLNDFIFKCFDDEHIDWVRLDRDALNSNSMWYSNPAAINNKTNIVYVNESMIIHSNRRVSVSLSIYLADEF